MPPVVFPPAVERAAVLVVDDEFGPREAMAFSLGPEFMVHKAGRAAEAWRPIRETRYDVVVLDIRMPEMDGITALGRIRELDAGRSRRLLEYAGGANGRPSIASIEPKVGENRPAKTWSLCNMRLKHQGARHRDGLKHLSAFRRGARRGVDFGIATRAGHHLSADAAVGMKRRRVKITSVGPVV